ncbi:MAG: ABC transporter substrate-binding protein, partial [Acidimicrobiales bacterium]
MNWKYFDQARKDVGPVELDLIESYAQGKVSRRNFVKRGTIIGLSAPFMGAIIAACGSDGDEGGSSATTTGGDGDSDGSTATTAPAPTGGAGGNLICGIQEGDANSGLDPVAMLDLGTYCVISQSFEYLVGLGSDGNIADTGLATSWSPNADGSVWTFDLRDGPVWTDGSPVTSADVAATMDRHVEFGNAGLAGVIGPGSVDSSDPKKAVITLLEPNGNFPVLVSIFNAQSVITP